MGSHHKLCHTLGGAFRQSAPHAHQSWDEYAKATAQAPGAALRPAQSPPAKAP